MTQQKPQASQIRVRTGEVVVDVNVTDRDGKPVRGLTESDFEVFEDGAKQQIASFRSIIRNAPSQVPVSTPEKVAQPPDLVADTSTYPHLISLVVDQVNMEPGDNVRAATAASAYVDKFLRKDDMVAVFGIGFGVHIYHRFTGDRAGLAKAIQDATSGNTSDLVSGMERIGAYLEEYYVLTYMPSNTINDGKFRTISVKLKRPRLDVRARKGYYALPDTENLPLVGYEAELLEILNSKSPPRSSPFLQAVMRSPGLKTIRQWPYMCSSRYRSSRSKSAATPKPIPRGQTC